MDDFDGVGPVGAGWQPHGVVPSPFLITDARGPVVLRGFLDGHTECYEADGTSVRSIAFRSWDNLT